MTESKSSSLIRIRRRVLGDAGVGDQDLDRAAELSSASVKAASTDAASVTSQCTAEEALGRLPGAVGDGDVVAASAKARAMARPMPRLPPVTRTLRGSAIASAVLRSWAGRRPAVDAAPTLTSGGVESPVRPPARSSQSCDRLRTGPWCTAHVGATRRPDRAKPTC